MAVNIRKSDLVEVISGDHRGARGKVLLVDKDRLQVLVEGVNMVYRHVRPTRKNPQGGRVQKEAPIHISNVLPYDSGKGKGCRVRFDVKLDSSGKVVSKERKSVGGASLHEVSRADRSA